MHPHLKSLLVKAGCDPSSTDSQAQKFYDGMSEGARGSIDSQLQAMMAADPGAGTDPAGGDDGTADGLCDGKDGLSKTTAAAKTPPAAGLSATEAGAIAAKAAAAAIRHVQGPTDEAVLGQEQARVTAIGKIAALHKLDDAQTSAILATGKSVADSRLLILKEVEKKATALHSVKVGDDLHVASLSAALPQALLLRGGMDQTILEKGGKIHERAADLSKRSTRGMVMMFLASLGATNVHELSDRQLAMAMDNGGMRRQFPRMAALAETTSDFANITLDAQNKALRAYYLDAKRTWPIWAEKKFAPNFKTIHSIALSEAQNMTLRNEGGEVQYGYLGDSGETAVLAEYAQGVRVSRRTMINDDLNALVALPRLHSNAAARLEDDTAYLLITANANMADGGALFNATAYSIAGETPNGGHQNYTSSGAGPSVSTLQTGATLMMKQKGPLGVARLELAPKFILVPTSIAETTKEFIGSQTLIAAQSSSGSAPSTVGDRNPFFNRYQVVPSTRLDDNSATAWYLMYDFREGQVGTFQIYFLQDEPEPVIKQETDFDTDDLKSLCRHTVAGLVADFRGVYKNNGA